MIYHDGHALRELAQRLFESMYPKSDWFGTSEGLKQEFERHVRCILSDKRAIHVAGRFDDDAAYRA